VAIIDRYARFAPVHFNLAVSVITCMSEVPITNRSTDIVRASRLVCRCLFKPVLKLVLHSISGLSTFILPTERNPGSRSPSTSSLIVFSYIPVWIIMFYRLVLRARRTSDRNLSPFLSLVTFASIWLLRRVVVSRVDGSQPLIYYITDWTLGGNQGILWWFFGHPLGRYPAVSNCRGCPHKSPALHLATNRITDL